MSDHSKRYLTAVVALATTACVATALCAQTAPSNAPAWPAVTQEAKPWTRWWWHGSAVDAAGITADLESMSRAGLGGVEVTPIYGVRGEESRFLRYLSPEWAKAFAHALNEAKRLGLGVDMATGTGWPFGGPWVSPADASKYVAHTRYMLQGGERLRQPVSIRQTPLVRAVSGQVPIERISDPVSRTPNLQSLALDQVRFAKPLPLLALVAFSSAGASVDLTDRVASDGTLDWTAPEGRWTLYAVFQGWHGKQVERAAPGGEGDVIDHFSAEAIERYLPPFDTLLARLPADSRRTLRGFFNDSYEVDDASGQADWTPKLFDEFRARRGYDLRQHLDALFGDAGDDTSSRVLSDYRESISELLIDRFTIGWRDWAHARGAIVRDQAHGSPANILDVYAATDIPETEGTELLRIKFATSAANVSGRRLVSAEAATWLGEHFRSTLADVRTSVDRFLLGGVNHLFYHGTAYSPPSDPWPGWQFYAAVEFNPRNSWWTDFSTLNRYVARVQSFLQLGEPANDVLLYFPIYDRWAERGRGSRGAGPARYTTSVPEGAVGFGPVPASGGLVEHFDGPLPNDSSAFRAAADSMLASGVAFDYISDRQLSRVRVSNRGLRTAGGASHRTIVIPASRFIPERTLSHVIALARGGATVVAYRGLPADVPGLWEYPARRARFDSMVAGLRFVDIPRTQIRQARVGRGRVLLGSNLDDLLAHATVRRERMIDSGLQVVRRRHADGMTYFIVNATPRPIDAWTPMATAARAAAIHDPMRGRSGYARVRPSARSPEETEIFLQLAPGESRIVRTFERSRAGASWRYVAVAGARQPIEGRWSLEFIEGGPERPAPMENVSLGSWTALQGNGLDRFSGTGRYRIAFAQPVRTRPDDVVGWRLDLGVVHESARVRLNGEELGTLLGPTFHVDIAAESLRENNVLEISVTNLSANRIADLDKRGVPWKKFYNINFPARLRENRGADGLFTAAHWTPLPSGLVGPVTLTPLRRLSP